GRATVVGRTHDSARNRAPDRADRLGRAHLRASCLDARHDRAAVAHAPHAARRRPGHRKRLTARSRGVAAAAPRLPWLRVAVTETRTALVEDLIARFPHIPPEAVLKEDLLRTGIAFDASALTDNLDGEVKPKSYFIFSFDQKPLAELGEAAKRRPPEEVALTGGPYELRRTIVSVRVNPSSPYRVAREDGELRLSLEGHEIARVGLPPMPEYYRHPLANGKTVMEPAPPIQWGYLVYLTVVRLCQYFGAHEEGGFCDITHNWRQHKKEGRPYTGVKPVEDVLEALQLIDRYDDGGSKAY